VPGWGAVEDVIVLANPRGGEIFLDHIKNELRPEDPRREVASAAFKADL